MSLIFGRTTAGYLLVRDDNYGVDASLRLIAAAETAERLLGRARPGDRVLRLMSMCTVIEAEARADRPVVVAATGLSVLTHTWGLQDLRAFVTRVDLIATSLQLPYNPCLTMFNHGAAPVRVRDLRAPAHRRADAGGRAHDGPHPMKPELVIILRGSPCQHRWTCETETEVREEVKALLRQLTPPPEGVMPGVGWTPPAFVEVRPGFFVRPAEIAAVFINP